MLSESARLFLDRGRRWTTFLGGLRLVVVLVVQDWSFGVKFTEYGDVIGH